GGHDARGDSGRAVTEALRRRYFHHAGRVVAARCLSCARRDCWECVTEHDGRVLCATCLAATAPAVPRRTGARSAARGATAVLGLATAWVFFYLFGRGLLLARTAFHEGKLWRDAPEARP